MKTIKPGKFFYWRQVITGLFLCFFAVPALAFNNFHLMHAIYSSTILVQSFAIGIGLCLFLGGLFKLKRYGEMRTIMSQQMTVGKPMMMMLSGIMLLTLPTVVTTFLRAFWGSATPLAYPMVDNSNASMAINGIIALVRFIGFAGMVRGIVLLSRSGGEQAQPGMAGKALLHIVGGLLCLHILNVYYLLKDILDFNGL